MENRDQQREGKECVYGEKMFVAISGLIGAGKTTLAEALAKEMNLPIFYEPVQNNVYLADFYKDKKKYGFQLQVYLLKNRFEQQQQIVWSNKGGIADRSIYEDHVFAKMLMEEGCMDKRDYQTYMGLFRILSNFMRRPNLIVHLDVSPEESLERIKRRNRGCESGIPLDYLKALHKGYEGFLNDISRRIPVIRVNWEKFHSAEKMAKMIRTKFEKMRSIYHVDLGGVVNTSMPRIPSMKLSAAKGLVEKATKGQEVDEENNEENNVENNQTVTDENAPPRPINV